MRHAAPLLAVCVALTAPARANDIDRMMELIPRWVGGQYSTAAQYQADQASAKPDAEKHRLMYQLLQRIDAPGFEGVVFFEQGSSEGTTDPEQVWRASFLQFIPDPATGVVRQRSLLPKDAKAFVNAHLQPAGFARLTPDAVTWDANCDFLLKLSDQGRAIAGPMRADVCKRPSPSTGETMIAEDRVVIRDGVYEFLGRYRNVKGEIIWGNESDQLNRLERIVPSPQTGR
jgi:hypothetical protein